MYYNLLKILFSGKDEMILKNLENLIDLIEGTVDEMFVNSLNPSGNFRNYIQKPEISDKILVLNGVLMMALSDKTDIEIPREYTATCTLLGYKGREIISYLKGRIHLIQKIMLVNDFLYEQHCTHRNEQIILNRGKENFFRNLDVRILRLHLTTLSLHYALIT